MADVYLGTWNQCAPYIQNFRRGIDVGFRGGDFAKYMMPAFDDVIGFEFRIKKKFKVENLIAYAIALGDSDYTAYTNFKAGRIKGKGDRAVRVKTLDQFNYNDVDFIKIDVEGWEPKVLRGAKKTIDRCNPVICVEINKGDNESQWLLESWGYELKEIDHLQGHDFIFVREDWEPE